MTRYFDVTTIVREALLTQAFSNEGILPPTRLNTIASQFGQFLTNDQASNAYALGHTLSQQGIGLRSLSAVLLAVQSMYLERNETKAAVEAARRIHAVIEGFVDHQLAQIRAEQERFRQAEARAIQPNPVE